MKSIHNLIVSTSLSLGFATTAMAHEHHALEGVGMPNATVISDLSLLRSLNIPVLASREHMNIGVAEVTPEQRQALSIAAHDRGSCAGYKAVLKKQSFGPKGYDELLAPIEKRHAKNNRPGFTQNVILNARAEISKAVARVDEQRLRQSVEWFSSFHTRYHASATNNDHANQLKSMIESFLSNTKMKHSVELINHTSTNQKSLRVRLEGAQRPNEVIVIGGHYDSIVTDFFGRPNAKGRSPGADDNASGSSTVLEALRVLAETGVQPERTIDFIWYAAEEVGLYGSQEIAANYRRNKVDVIGVMQLDMTMFPGNGELNIASMTDYTSPWLRSVFAELNRLYIGAKIKNSACGYGCSDHASWHDEGYPTVMPAEADMQSINSNIHTVNDQIDSRSNFKHMAAFAKGAIAFAMELGNSTLREK